jgi:hypothetical protein
MSFFQSINLSKILDEGGDEGDILNYKEKNKLRRARRVAKRAAERDIQEEEAEEEEEEEEEDAPLFICPECPKGYNELKRLNDHVKKYHPADPDSLICPSCDKHFSCTSSVTSHLSNGHCPVVPYLFFLVYQGLIFLSILFVR